MSKSFSDMTPLERHVNRARQRHGLPLDWTEEKGARDLPEREGKIVSGAILEHVNKTMQETDAAHANERALGQTLKRLGLD